MKEKKLGTWPLGIGEATLIADYSDWGGSFSFWPDGKRPEIRVSMLQKTWSRTLEILLHEVMEFSFTQIGRRYSPAPDFGQSSASYYFSMNHEEFTDAVARTGSFLEEAIPALSKEWAAYKKKRRK